MRSTSQIVSSLYDRADGDASLARLLCQDCAVDLALAGAALSLADDHGSPAVLASSDPVVESLEKLQFELGEGPAVDASVHHRPALHPYLDHTSVGRWPAFAPAALDVGVRAVFALPLQAVAVQLGVLGLYRKVPGALGDDATAAARAYADAAVVLLLNLQAAAVDGESATIEGQLEHNAEVHQATGFLSVTASVGVTEALLLLRAHAFASGRPLLHVARDVLAGRVQIRPEEGHDG